MYNGKSSPFRSSSLLPLLPPHLRHYPLCRTHLPTPSPPPPLQTSSPTSSSTNPPPPPSPPFGGPPASPPSTIPPPPTSPSSAPSRPTAASTSSPPPRTTPPSSPSSASSPASPPRNAVNSLHTISARYSLPDPPLRFLNCTLNALVRFDIDISRFFRENISAKADQHTFGILINALCRTYRIAEAFKLLSRMKTFTSPPNAVMYNTLIHALCRLGKVGWVRSLMAGMNDYTVITFNIMISAYCRAGDVVQVLVMLDKCFEVGLVPDVTAVTKIVQLLCSFEQGMEAVEVLESGEAGLGN